MNRAISIIVPILNERLTIESLQEQLLPSTRCAEIILVDGGSTDGTLDLIDPTFSLVRSDRGRSRQMNAGASIARGETLFFLHGDSILPPHPLEAINEVMRDHRAGCFGVRFDDPRLLMRINGYMSNRRVRTSGIMFGDQGIFIERNLFIKVGMFRDLPIMEDYQLSLDLRTLGEKVGMTKEPITTSTRRYPRSPIGTLRLMAHMHRLRRMYREGVDPYELAKLYKDVR